MNHPQVDLAAIARQEMMERGFAPDFPPAALQQAAVRTAEDGAGLAGPDRAAVVVHR